MKCLPNPRSLATLPLILMPFASMCETDSYRNAEGAFKWKTLFANRELEVVSQPFVGVHTSGGLEPGLFTVHSTGVSTKPVVEAASAFLDTLRPDQQVRTVFGIDDPEWRRWCNVDNGIYVRQGSSLKEMDPAQRTAAINLMRASLSAKGLQLTEDIRKTDHTLGEINDNILTYDEDLYFFTLMGIPSETEPWGWQVDGHHLVINYFVLGDQVVMTPAFLGAEPAVTTTGKYKGNSLFQDEQNQGLAFYRMLDPEQKDRATLAKEKSGHSNRAEAFKDNLELDFAGLAGKEMSAGQRAALLRLVSLYTGNLRDGHAELWLQDIEDHLDETHFAWEGGDSDEAKFYYRIHSPVILIEFDHQQPIGTTSINPPELPTRDHIHTVIRTPNGNDYGKDLLRQHLEQHPHR